MTRFNVKMNALEYRAIFSLSSVLALRMLGLFMALPLFALYAKHLINATPFLIGLSLGVYGLTQALFQIPFGVLSDHMGRKKVIIIGLSLFILGSILAGLAHTINQMILARALQGTGAVGSTILALLADLTRPEQRTKALAISGMTIGLSFSLAMLLGPILAAWIQVNGIFWLAALFGLIAIIILLTCVPVPILAAEKQSSYPSSSFFSLLKHPDLLRLNFGIFFLHLIFTASFVIIPISLQTLAGLKASEQWLLYLPAFLMAFILSLISIIIAEKQKKIKYFFIGGILLLAIAEFLLWIFSHNLLLSGISLLLFFTAFSLLEAFLPSLVSRTAPANRKGAALGIYSCSQFLGIFAGGILGGWLYSISTISTVYLFLAVMGILWASIAFKMKNPQYAA